MGLEIERKFLVCGNEWQRLATGRTRIQQAYLPAEASLSMRVRIKNEDYATLTLNVFAGNARARAFYEKSGFSVETVRYTKRLA